MIQKPVCGRPGRATDIPNKQLAVAATRGKLSSIWAPFQSTHVAHVPLEPQHEVLRRSGVAVQYAPITSTAAEKLSTCSKCAHTQTVAGHGPHALHASDIPEVHVAGPGAHSKE